MREFKRMQIPALTREPNTTCSEIVAEAAFALASGIIDTIPFVGSKLDEQQTRAWPRSGVFTDDGVEMTGTPPEIFELCELLAAHIEKGTSFDVFEVFHKIARIDRLIDWRHGAVLSPEPHPVTH
ncbi:hypothetical protein ACOJBM_33580 [Rhizobium beringeri]|jgi:hypothetical protein|uniref:Uncharacterized protein n=4 Tax=Rhizobium TaxID=379 RepID=A0A2Z4YMB2_RHILE|nr:MULTISPECIES: hypothetical protein [Rhizobium]MVO91436.1 hypothetical protein [Rhizobium leguminosarum bv. phaseoli]OBY04107.1 hypothetical protein BAE36_27370 [Rhizobium leguminosarum bv. trifolii]OOO41358.1 hypothetical protein BS629_35970 [Rhizobium leguminosarum bv. viciae USDA 2370]ASS58613.1 hypothetical protein CHR56_29015 [Rhizobium leguminosarum bv. viciae]AXA42544.1 hypothetical protein DLJ82_4983 [Rhizobium leguminosarum]